MARDASITQDLVSKAAEEISSATATSINPREQKQHETRLRIAETGLQLFLIHGYEGTTPDAVAEAAGISRRTFFSYFRSKDDIVLAWQEGEWDAMRAELLKVSPDEAPLDAVRKTLINHVSRYESEKMRAIDHVMRASETQAGGIRRPRKRGFTQRCAKSGASRNHGRRCVSSRWSPWALRVWPSRLGETRAASGRSRRSRKTPLLR